MSKDCNKYKEILIDVFYGEDIMNKDTKKHIDNCQECKKYFNELQQMNTALDDIDDQIPIEYMNIKQAFNRAEDIQNKRNILSLIFFMVISSIILAAVITLAFQGFAREIIYIQIAMYFILPISLLVFIKVRAVKEGYNE